jgi:hypothetical protein
MSGHEEEQTVILCASGSIQEETGTKETSNADIWYGGFQFQPSD